jgi:hypothetical protein
MDMARAAAIALRDDTSVDAAYRRALETAIAVAYMRPFARTNSVGCLTDDDAPTGEWIELHEWLDEVRDKRYAHIDKEGGRSAELMVTVDDEGVANSPRLSRGRLRTSALRRSRVGSRSRVSTTGRRFAAARFRIRWMQRKGSRSPQSPSPPSRAPQDSNGRCAVSSATHEAPGRLRAFVYAKRRPEAKSTSSPQMRVRPAVDP